MFEFIVTFITDSGFKHTNRYVATDSNMVDRAIEPILSNSDIAVAKVERGQRITTALLMEEKK
ncbi:MAG: hypothetical protein ACWGQW_01530 [bacterium]